MSFASGRHALGICDRCGWEYPLNDLIDQVRAGLETGLLVCSECDDADNPQLLLGRLRFDDPEALRNPRPDTGNPISRGLSSFDPVGSGQINNGQAAGFILRSNVGVVSITI